MKQRITTSLTFLGLCWTSVAPAAVLTEWGTSASASSADCSVLACTKTDFFFFNPIIAGNQVGGLNQSSAELLDDVNPDGRGTASARVTLQGGLAIPELARILHE